MTDNTSSTTTDNKTSKKSDGRKTRTKKSASNAKNGSKPSIDNLKFTDIDTASASVNALSSHMSMRQISLQSGVNAITLKAIKDKTQNRVTNKVLMRLQEWYEKEFNPNNPKESRISTTTPRATRKTSKRGRKSENKTNTPTINVPISVDEAQKQITYHEEQATNHKNQASALREYMKQVEKAQTLLRRELSKA